MTQNAPHKIDSALQRPRVLLLDMTRIGDGTATGEVKSSLFAEWPKTSILQIYVAGRDKLGVYSGISGRTVGTADAGAQQSLERLAREFDPDVIIYRPTPRTPHLHQAAMHLLSRLNVPFATWIMDDWPTAYQMEDPDAAAMLEGDWRMLLRHSAVRLSISEAMSAAFQERYGVDFIAIANGVDKADWPEPARESDPDVLKVRYAGSLAENMTLASIVKVAQSVERLAAQGAGIQFEIKTRDLWRRLAEPHLKGFQHTKIIAADFTPAEYRAWVSAADISIIAYNFDDASKKYTQYSLANKLPECLASGAPLIAIGPADSATIAALEKHDAGVRVTTDSIDAITDALKALASSPALRQEQGSKGRQTAFLHFSLSAAREKLRQTLIAASRERFQPIIALPSEPRAAGAHVDETAVVAELLSGRRGRSHVMIDVGAHHGTSAAYFNKLGWTIHCFEPDAANRAKLEERFDGADAVSIDARAVSEKPQTGVAFFTSQESTGISGLSAFRETHEETDRVDTTTVAAIIRERKIPAIDFLKIDVEGFDFSVLKGVPWDECRPDVIECEFEDAKTKPLGHSWRDIAAFLAGKGYAVYISEWHPIIRYGIPHDWKRLAFFSESTDIPANAWGNLLAFREDPGVEKIEDAFSAHMKRRNILDDDQANKVSHGNMLRANAKNKAAGERPFYAEFGERLQRRSPRLFAVLRILRRIVSALWRRRLWVAPALLILAAALAAGLLQSDLQRRLLVTGGVGIFAMTLALIYLGWWTYHRVHALATETSHLRAKLAQKADLEQARNFEAASRETVRRLERRLEKKEADFSGLEQKISRLAGNVNAALAQVTALSTGKAELDEIIAEIDEAFQSLELDLGEYREAQTDYNERIEALRRRLDELEGAVQSVIDARVSLGQ